MKTVYQSKYLTLVVETENQLIRVLWSVATEYMSDAEFRIELTKYAEISEEHQPKKSLVDTKHFLMPVAPEVQEWVNENIHQRSLKAGIKKFAYLVSKNIFSQVSIEQTMEESNAKEIFDTQYFEGESQAIEWLNA